MDMMSMVRTLGALGMVLGMLAGALWVVRRYDLKLPGRVAGPGRKRVEMVERLTIDAKRSVALIRRDGCEHLILIGPEGPVTLEAGIVSAAPAPSPQVQAEAFEASFGTLVDLPKPAKRKRTYRPRDTRRWNRAAVREALNA
jgi:flagellar protein FliO/FliZ